jgi:hypothetical protein
MSATSAYAPSTSRDTAAGPPAPRPARSAPEALLPALRRLDARLADAVAVAEAVYGAGAAADAYRGLYIDLAQVNGLMAREPAAPLFGGLGTPDDVDGTEDGDGTPLGRMAALYGLSPWDVDALLVALAPELDLRYERLYAYLQDDVTRRRPTVSLVLDLLCTDAADRLRRRVHLAPHGPLVRAGLLHVVPDPNQLRPPLLAHCLKVDEQAVAYLLGEPGPDARLSAFCTLLDPPPAERAPVLDPAVRAALHGLAGARPAAEPLFLYLRGPDRDGAAAAAAVCASAAAAPLLRADLGAAPPVDADLAALVPVLFREARLRGAVLHVAGMDGVWGEGRTAALAAFYAALARHDGIVLLAGEAAWNGAGYAGPAPHQLSLEVPPFERRRACWTGALNGSGGALDDGELDALADRFRLLPGQVDRAVAEARNRARWRAAAEAMESAGSGQSADEGGSADARTPRAADLFAAARAASGETLAQLARKVEPVYGWDDLVLPPDSLAQLRELWQRVAHRHTVLGGWGFGRKLAHGKGVTALFSGPSGTGKTMAAQVLAGALELDLYRIDLSSVVSKYIGETEKNLSRVFADAEAGNSILFFDEADALFGKRSEVKDAHDRYANIEIGYLLQRMEEHEGVTILATNLRKNMDEAFVRRLAFSISFPFPDDADRLRIWEQVWPGDTPRAESLDLAFMARRFRLTGGNIKNVALAAAFLAADEGAAVGMEHVVRATRREFQKMGKVCVEADFGPWFPLVSER